MYDFHVQYAVRQQYKAVRVFWPPATPFPVLAPELEERLYSVARAQAARGACTLVSIPQWVGFNHHCTMKKQSIISTPVKKTTTTTQCTMLHTLSMRGERHKQDPRALAQLNFLSIPLSNSCACALPARHTFSCFGVRGCGKSVTSTPPCEDAKTLSLWTLAESQRRMAQNRLKNCVRPTHRHQERSRCPAQARRQTRLVLGATNFNTEWRCGVFGWRRRQVWHDQRKIDGVATPPETSPSTGGASSSVTVAVSPCPDTLNII